MTKLALATVLLATFGVAAAIDTPRETRTDVARVQRTLDDLGYRAGTPDGRLGPRTRTAIRNFQRDKNLNATGQLTDETVTALDDAARDAADARREPGSRTERTMGTRPMEHPSPATVRRAQTALDRLGYPIRDADGTLGDDTRTALRNFQRDKNLNATGELDDETMRALDADAGRATSGSRPRR
jgi:peptidoglycan hydrolase-like protein with peptidoglycan-binding domain